MRALLLLPFIVPTVLSTVAWMWMLDPAFSVVNRLLVALGWPKPGPSWLGDPTLAMIVDHHHQHVARTAFLRASHCSPDCKRFHPSYTKQPTIRWRWRDGRGSAL